MREYVVWGGGGHAQLLIDNFEGLEEQIEVFLDIREDRTKLGNVPVIRPEAWNRYESSTIVVCVKNKFHEIYNELVCKYHCIKEKIISSHEWICRLLVEQKIKLRPKSVRLETCTLCQLDCPYCYMRTGNYGTMGKGYLSYEKFLEFVQKNSYINRIEISNNGEVFLNPDLGKILLCAQERGIKITIGNGSNFNTVSDEMLELLVKTGVSFINISIDGASQNVYSMYRRRGDFNKVISNIKKLNAYKKMHHSDFPHLQWQYILMQHNECDVEHAVAMAAELDMNISFKYECVKGEFEPEDRNKLEKLTGLKFFSMNEYNAHHNDRYGAEMCCQTIFNPQINFDGRLLGCCMLWNEDFGVNVFEEGLVNALNSQEYLRIVYTLLGIEQSYEQMMNLPCIHCQHCGHCGPDIRKRNYLYL